MTALLVGLACFALHAAVSLVALRLPGRMSPVARHAASAFGTHIVGIAVAAMIVGPFAYWPAAAVNGLLVVCWLFAFSAVYKSVSLRILTHLDRVPDHSLTIDAIAENYVRPEFAARALVLVKMGCVVESNGEFALTEKGKAIARRIALVQRVWGIESGGMYGSLANPDREGGGGVSNHPLPHGRSSPGTIPPIPRRRWPSPRPSSADRVRGSGM
jgi:hypothetical protein